MLTIGYSLDKTRKTKGEKELAAAQWIEAIRFTAWTVEAACVFVVSHYLAAVVRNPNATLTRAVKVRLLTGGAVKSLGWTLHQLYWWVWQHAASAGRVDMKEALEVYSYVTAVSYAFVFAGAGLILSPFFERLAGRFWALLLCAAVISTLGAGALIAR